MNKTEKWLVAGLGVSLVASGLAIAAGLQKGKDEIALASPDAQYKCAKRAEHVVQTSRAQREQAGIWKLGPQPSDSQVHQRVLHRCLLDNDKAYENHFASQLKQARGEQTGEPDSRGHR